MRRLIAGTGMSLMFLITALAANAAGLDGKAALLCALTEADDCIAGRGCKSDAAGSLNLPNFVRVDFANKLISTTRENPNKRTTKIAQVIETESELLIQGSDAGRGWTASLNRETGALAVTATGNGLTFVAFGMCTAG